MDADKRYRAPDGRTFHSYEQARAYWEQQRQGPAGKKVPRKRAAASGAKDLELSKLKQPESTALLVTWLPGFTVAVMRARAMCLDVRSTRTQLA
jgi:hypothetical protein